MNYLKHYQLLINKAKNRQLTVYVEKHHIQPKCLGGNDDIENIISLLPEEHFLAHQLLVKMYPENVSLKFALHLMTISTKYVIRNNKEFAWIRKQNAIAISKTHKGAKRKQITRERISKAKTGIPMKEETKQKISKKLKGIPKNFTPKAIQNIRIAATKRGQSWREHVIASNKSRNYKGRNHPTVKQWLFISPAGEEHVFLDGFDNFCRLHGLPLSTMAKIRRGIPVKSGACVGWKIKELPK